MPERVIDDVRSALRAAKDPIGACQAAVAVLGERTPALVAVLLHVRDRLRCVAATGTWQIYSSTPTTRGIVGRVFASGETATVTDVATDPDYFPLRPDAVVEICAPLMDPDGRPIGVLNLEWSRPIDADAWRTVVSRVARLLSAHLQELGGPPAETRSEQLLRHALALTGAVNEAELLERSITAACEVSGLSTAVLLMRTPAGVNVYSGLAEPDSLAGRLGRRLSRAAPAALAHLLSHAHALGASYTAGDPAGREAYGFEELTGEGVQTMIAVPAGPPESGAVVLVIDERASAPSPATVNQLELLAAHAWTALERIRTLRRLHERASSDPLTGLRHYGPFGERLAASAPGKTALLAIDIDYFKSINDTYGHRVGDQVLIELARALEKALRDSDDLYRIGGDEFVAVLEVHGSQEAAAIAERLCAAARETAHPVSVGVAVQGDDEPAEATLRRADAALYEAKRAGRNQVRLAGPASKQSNRAGE